MEDDHADWCDGEREGFANRGGGEGSARNTNVLTNNGRRSPITQADALEMEDFADARVKAFVNVSKRQLCSGF